VQGRVWSIVSLISQLGMIVAFAIAGTLADKVFNPMLQPNGALASSAGQFIGTGNGRGIGLMFVISGVLVLITSAAIGRLRSIKNLD
jgi:MFS transporter, DHA3 family, macrolide efflux protein